MSKTQIFTQGKINEVIEKLRLESALEKTSENLKLVFGLIDLTTLSADDTSRKVSSMCSKVNSLPEHFPGGFNVGAICVYPAMVPVVRETLKAGGVNIASVAAGFPSSQTFFTVKEMECRMAVEAGATEIDIVIPVGRYLENDLDFVRDEISGIRKAIHPAKLKVILETGLLPGPEDIYNASMLCMRAGADFIKTSTGKIQPASTPEAVFIMCSAIKAFYEETGKRKGIKPAGGIGTTEQALEYAGIIKGVLGEKWLSPSLFRIGASRLANQILSDITILDTGIAPDSDYF